MLWQCVRSARKELKSCDDDEPRSRQTRRRRLLNNSNYQKVPTTYTAIEYVLSYSESSLAIGHGHASPKTLRPRRRFDSISKYQRMSVFSFHSVSKTFAIVCVYMYVLESLQLLFPDQVPFSWASHVRVVSKLGLLYNSLHVYSLFQLKSSTTSQCFNECRSVRSVSPATPPFGISIWNFTHKLRSIRADLCR